MATKKSEPAGFTPVFLKFIGPMASLTRGKNRFEKDKIYKVLDENTMYDLLETERFIQVRDPTKPQPKPSGGVRIHSARPSPFEEKDEELPPERGDLSQEDLRRGGDSAQRQPEEPAAEKTIYTYKREGSDEEIRTTDIQEVLSPGNTLISTEKEPAAGVEGDVDEIVEEHQDPADQYPRLPASQFTSKKEAIKWAEDNLGAQLDKNKSIVWLNNEIVRLHGEKYGRPDEAEEVDDDTREENTKVDAVVVA